MTAPELLPAGDVSHGRGIGIADVSVDRPIFALMMSLALVVVGLMSYRTLGVDLLPAVEQPQVTVFTALPGAGPEEIESAITQPIEEQLNTIAGIEEMRSVNREGFSFVILTFTLDRPIDEAVQDVRDKLSRVVRALPEGTQAPVISTFDSESTPILAVALSGPSSLRELTEFAETRVKDLLATAPGVGAVTLEGGQRRAINVIVDAHALAARGVTVVDVRRALELQNVEIPGGRVTRQAREDILRVMARVERVDQLGDVVIAQKKTPLGESAVLLKDVAEVVDGTVELRGTSRLNGQPAVTLTVQKLAGSNIVATAAAVKERVERIRSVLPAGAEMIILRDASVFVEESVAEARFHLVGGAILAALAVLLFMGSWRSTLIAAVAIPASIIATFAVMKAFGFTLNNITLLALTLAVGVVIDDAIVVVENIHRKMHDDHIPALLAAKVATREIALAVSATTLSLVVIFLPVAFMTGQVGRLFYSYGITVAASILVSLFVAFTLTPMLASRFLSSTPPAPMSFSGRLDRLSQAVMAPLERAYVRAVAWSLDHRAIVVVVALALVASTVPLFRLAPSDFMPEDDQSEFEVSVELPTGTSFTAADDVMQELELQLQHMPGVKDVLATIGDARGAGSATRATLYVGLFSIAERKALAREQKMPMGQVDIMTRSRGIFQRYPDLRPTIRSLNTSGIGGPGYGGKLRVAVRGPDLKKLEEILQTVLKEARGDPSFVDVFSPSADRLPELRVVPDRKKAADLGTTPKDLAENLRILVGGDVVSSFKDGDERYDIILRAALKDRDSLEHIGALPLQTARAGTVTVDNVAALSEAQGATLILRLGGLRQVFVSANPAPGVTLGAAVERIQAVIERANLPPGYDTVLMGDAKTLDETRREFVLALLLSLVFVYMVLAAQFESLLHPITILLAIPLTAPFALLSILLLKESVNVYSIFGVFMLFGIVKKNGILQVDTTNQLVAKGMEVRAAILEANRVRLRPILMTTLTLIAAMAPMTIAEGPGAASRAALAKVIVGGQALSLVVSLLIVPVAWSLFHGAAERWRRRSRPDVS
jgi:HAE1 family hydrophobic/amphiphilic exporter-1